MTDLYSQLERLLPFVDTPGQYVGAEVNAIRKDPSKVSLSVCLAYPDTYAVGMSHVGMRILYDVLNSRPDVLAERAFAPWPDLGGAMRDGGVPAFSLESHRALSEFDVAGFSLQYELNAPTVLYILDLAGIPLRSEERGEEDPLILGGGSVALNPEPVAAFFDLFLLGEAEEAILELADVLIRCNKEGLKRRDTLLAAAKEVEGVYVPSLYEAVWEKERQVGLKPLREGLPETIRRRVVRDLDAAPFPVEQVVPNVNIVHDRLAVEIMRGCTRGCRFCQATSIYRPTRSRRPQTLKRLVCEGLEATGYSEVGLLSLTPGDYPGFLNLVRALSRELEPQMVNLSLPSLRVTPELMEIPEVISAVRKSGLTFAPECATDRLRMCINKDILNEELFRGVEAAFAAGWDTVKLYFMIGLPGETEEDVAAIPSLIREVAGLRKKSSRRGARVNVTVSCFVPKPHTALQWAAMEGLDDLASKQRIVREPFEEAGGKVRIRVRTHDRFMSQVEALIARGDRRVAGVIEKAYLKGEVFSPWDEQFGYDRWRTSWKEAGIDIEEAVHSARELDEPLPWDFIDCGVRKDFFEREWVKSKEGSVTPDCAEDECNDCGACGERAASGGSKDGRTGHQGQG